MGRDSGLGLAILAGILLFSLKPRKSLNGFNGNGGSPAYLGPLPTTSEEAEDVTQEVLRTGKITVHRTVVNIPRVPTTTQIKTSRARIAEIDKRVPTWVKEGWKESTKAVSRQGYLPRGEM